MTTQTDDSIDEEEDNRYFHLVCSECGHDLLPGDKAIAATLGEIDDDGGYYMDDIEPWLWVKHAPKCPQKQKRW